MTQKLKIMKLNPSAVIPKFQTEGSAGLDLMAIDVDMEILTWPTYPTIGATGNESDHNNYSRKHYKFTYSTGLAFEIPEGHVGLIFPRSSIHKTDMVLTNCVGVIDSDYRGEVKFIFRSNGEEIYKPGDRVGQLVLVKLPEIEIVEVAFLNDTVRGTGGFGSTGR